MFAAYYELALVASLSVRSLAGRLFSEIRDDYAEAETGGPKPRQDLALHDHLLAAMREDLQEHAPLVPAGAD